MAERIPPITELCSSIIGNALHNSSELEEPYTLQYRNQYEASRQQCSTPIPQFHQYEQDFSVESFSFGESEDPQYPISQQHLVFGKADLYSSGMGLQLPLLPSVPYEEQQGYTAVEDYETISCDGSGTMQMGGDASSLMENDDPHGDSLVMEESCEKWERRSRPGRRGTREGGGRRKNRRRTPTLAQRKAANIRERKRMCNLNKAFDMLRKIIPTFAYEKHLSRIDTLRLAMDYIKFMEEIMVKPEEDLLKYANAAHEMAVKWNARV